MSDLTPQVIIIAGPNGAGKTTSAPFLLRDEMGVQEYVNADPIASGLSGFNPGEVAFAAGRVMLKRIEGLYGAGKTFAVESTLAGKSYRRWLEKLLTEGYTFQLIYLWLRSADLAVERVRQRVAAGGHDVREEVIRRRYSAGLKNFWDLYQPLADAWAVYDNSEQKLSLVAKGDKEVPLLKYNQIAWIRFSLTKP
jgi:predicted ABC-type ATPase